MAADRFDRSPAHEPGSLFRDRTAFDGGIGLTVSRCEPGPAAQLLSAAEARDVTDFSDEYGGEDRSDTVDVLDRSIAGVVGELCVNAQLKFRDLLVEHLDQI